MSVPAELKVDKYLGKKGRMITASKGRASYDNPTSLYVFNANVVIRRKGDIVKLWYGDLNLSDHKDIMNLQAFAISLETEVYILSEASGRFENEKKPLWDKYVMRISKNGECYLGTVKDYYNLNADHTATLKPSLVQKPKDSKEDLCSNPYISKRVKPEKTVELQFMDAEMFKSMDKTRIPYINLAQYVADQLGIELSEVHVDQIYISKKLGIILNELTYDFLDRSYKGDKYRISREFSMINFAYSPHVVDWVDMEDNVIYIDNMRGENDE